MHTGIHGRSNLFTSMQPNRKIDFDMGKVTALKIVRDKIIELSRAMKELNDPVLSDLSLLPKLYEVYLDFFARIGNSNSTAQVYNRQKFLFVILYLYSPKTLAGGKMKIGLRDKLSDLFKLNSRTSISDNCSDIVFMYYNYRDFRRDVELLFNEMTNAIPEEFIYLS